MGQVLSILPAVNATLISLSGLFILRGVRAIRRGEHARHKRDMLLATGLAALFFVLYVIRIGLGGMTPFTGPSGVRTVYLAILASHVGLALVQTPLVLVTLYRALRSRFPKHRSAGRLTYPIWLYVSFSGVLVYGMLHFPYD